MWSGGNLTANNVFTGQSHSLSDPALPLDVLLADFPVAVLATFPS
jgi:hypothetical protein